MTLRRHRALTGHKALVDGIPFDMPVNSLDSPALMAGFTADAQVVRDLLPGEELAPLRLPNGRALMLVTVIEYRTTDIGTYIEFSIAFACIHRRAGSPLITTVLREGTSTFGQYVWDLPVSTLVSVKGGKGIWGMPKHQANLDFRISDTEMSSQYDLHGQLCMRITVKRPRGIHIPISNIRAANYCQFRGVMMKSTIIFSDKAEAAAGSRAYAELLIGPHPRMHPLRDLLIADRPLFVACLPHSHGILDDHIEGWFLTNTGRPPQSSEGLQSVIGLPNDQSWLPPPTAAGR